MTAAKKPPPPPDPPAGCTLAQRRKGTDWADVWIWSFAAGALTAQPQVVWSDAARGAELQVSPVRDSSGASFRVKS